MLTIRAQMTNRHQCWIAVRTRKLVEELIHRWLAQIVSIFFYQSLEATRDPTLEFFSVKEIAREGKYFSGNKIDRCDDDAIVHRLTPLQFTKTLQVKLLRDKLKWEDICFNPQILNPNIIYVTFIA